MGKGKILRRGEALTDLTTLEKSKTAEAPTSAGLLGPLPKQMNFYTGSAFITSPPPSFVPLTAFCKKSENNDSRHHLKP
ncbi:Hypothetical predicted protein [Olea europaea subsp. europaea]|uniref:Uncharacterized protein n=1 Tax=Olea europaea subsp. europaea TaxID=158383 RepID=A0A8S0UD13_OLEEU|nr:Hypothetical predicted protein [Olea europaea subsp. europaea]